MSRAMAGSERSTRAERLHRTALIWEQHCCLPLDVTAADVDFDQVLRYQASGVSHVSVNVGYGPHGIGDTVRTLAVFRSHVLARPDSYVLATTAANVREAKATGRVAVGFDLECTNHLEGRTEMMQTYYDLGVRSMSMAYNSETLAGFGCHNDPNGPLKPFGRAVVVEMNRVGMLVDASHCGYRTSMNLFEASSQPVIFSHSVALAVMEHPRNVSDEQIRACAQNGGVVGVNGVGAFLGQQQDIRTEAFMRHLNQIVSVAGPQHVGIGLNYVFDVSDLETELTQHSDLFPTDYPEDAFDPFIPPERLPEITTAMVDIGYPDEDIVAILGGNFLRVATQVWKHPYDERVKP